MHFGKDLLDEWGSLASYLFVGTCYVICDQNHKSSRTIEDWLPDDRICYFEVEISSLYDEGIWWYVSIPKLIILKNSNMWVE